MNFVSYETAVRLKEAGFPQPEPRFFQAWYNPAGDSVHKIPFIIEPAFRRMIDEYSIFAPTAEDILRELPDFAMYYGEYFDSWESGFFVFDTLRRRPDQYPTHHENPAEACALAWIEFHKK